MGLTLMDPTEQGQTDRRRRRRKKRQDEESIDSVSTISKIVEEEREKDNVSVENLDPSKKKKKLKKIKETSNDIQDEGMVKSRRKKKKKRAASLSSSEENDVEAEDGEKKGRRRREGKKKISGSQSLLKEDFYSDPQLATTLQGLEDDMYSVCGDADTSVLSPYPLVPSIPASQPVAKIYLEKPGGFSKTSVSAAVVSSSSSIPQKSSGSTQLSPLALGLTTQKMFRALSTFCHGFLAGLAAWQVFTIYILHNDDLEFVELYSPLSQPLMIVFYLLTIICTVSVCDRYDLAEFSLYHLRKLITLQSGGISILIYWSTLLLTLVTTRLDDKLSLFQHNSSLFEDMKPQDLSQELNTWKAMNLARSIAVVLGWFVVSLRPSTDLLYKHLKRLNSADRWKNSRIETVKMA